MIVDDLKLELPRGGDDPKGVRAALFRAKHFLLGEEGSLFVKRLIDEHRDLRADLVEFALPPFDYMALTVKHYRHAEFPDGLETMHLWAKGRYRLYVRGRRIGENEIGDAHIPGWTSVDSDGRLHNTVIEGRPYRDEVYKRLRTDHDVLMMIFLLLAQPRTYQVKFSEGSTGVRKGKIVRYMATSEIIINLRSPAQFRRLWADGSRGSPRRHEVRRHWWHFGGDRGHEHDWELVDTDPRKYVCACGRIRRERGPFERGDAGKGFVTQRYKLVA